MFSERYHKLNDLSWVSTPSKPADEPSYCRIGETQRIEQLGPPNPGNCMERRRKSVCQLDAWYRQPGQLQHVDWRRIPPSSNQHHQTFASRQGRHISSARNPWISTCGLHSYNRIPHKDFFVPPEQCELRPNHDTSRQQPSVIPRTWADPYSLILCSFLHWLSSYSKYVTGFVCL